MPKEFGDKVIKPGQCETVDLPLSLLSTHTPVNLTVRILRGKRPGPTMFVSAALHGDELNGVEIIRRLLLERSLKRMCGTLIAVPIVNVYGFISRERYLPDRRDLNRSFPGSKKGSLASQLANLLMNEVVSKSTVGIDLHTGSMYRSNLPQIRALIDDENIAELAQSFGAPLMINAGLRDGSMRSAASDIGVPVLVYEAGEALRFDESSIKLGVRGIINVMRHVGMLPPTKRKAAARQSIFAESSFWERAPEGGIVRAVAALGSQVEADGILGIVSDPFGDNQFEIRAKEPGIVIGLSHLPIANQGDALFHIARVKNPAHAVKTVEIITDANDFDETGSQIGESEDN